MSEQNFVPQYYQMNPETDDMLPNGGKIKNGMVVLLASPKLRYDITKKNPLDWQLDRMLERNRWAQVSHVISDGTTVVFIATYEDGTKRQVLADFQSAWLVKKNSLDGNQGSLFEHDSTYEVKRTEIYALVLGVMQTVSPEKIVGVSSLADNIARKIMVSFQRDDARRVLTGSVRDIREKQRKVYYLVLDAMNRGREVTNGSEKIVADQTTVKIMDATVGNHA